LADRDCAVPTYIGSGVGIITGNCGIPTAGQHITSIIFPTNIPASHGGAGVIGDANSTGKTTIPFVRDHVLTTCKCARGKSGCNCKCAQQTAGT